MRKVSRSETPSELNLKSITAGFRDRIKNITTQPPVPASQETIDRQNRSLTVLPYHQPLIEAPVSKLPPCDFCGEPAEYDANTDKLHGPGLSPWAFMCGPHFEEHSAGDLGTGRGQRLRLIESKVEKPTTRPYNASKTAGAWPSDTDWEKHLSNLEELLAETQKGVGWHAAKGETKEMKAHDKLAKDLQKSIDDIKKVMEFPGAKTASADSDDNWRDDHSNLDSDW